MVLEVILQTVIDVYWALNIGFDNDVTDHTLLTGFRLN